jgi:hypothetical protein
VARALGAQHALVDSRAVATAVGASLGLPGLHILQVRSARRRNVELHRALQEHVAEAVAAAMAQPRLPPPGRDEPGTVEDGVR